MIAPRFETMKRAIERTTRHQLQGRVEQVVGLIIESRGPMAHVGDVCTVDTPGGESVPCEVVGFRGDRVLMMPLGDLHGIGPGSAVRPTDGCLRVPVGDAMLGRVVDALGRPMDGKGPLGDLPTYPNVASPPNALQRKMIEEPFGTGVRAIDGFLTMGVGQRVGIFAGSGVGKSTLLGMIALKGSADVNVIALVGERGREVREFMENDLGPEGMAKSVVVCATSDEPALLRLKAALTATAIAEAFRDQGKNVLLMMDSVTRFAMAQREIGLAVGEPPSTKGYTPSVFALLPRLMERAGCSDKGAITAIYTVLVDGDDTNEPIADAARSILDGHIVLSRRLTSRAHYPPIDIAQSLSRVQPMVTNPSHVSAAQTLRQRMSDYLEIEDLINIGAFKEGQNPAADLAVLQWPRINSFLKQDKKEWTEPTESYQMMEMLANG
ncbi:MAG TPA: FliI/YscN family ATPase [Fimbriimonadaceae bacterium]|nr:FliI/YscN family ATPase [Fimbriimonadaceae bacterium]